MKPPSHVELVALAPTHGEVAALAFAALALPIAVFYGIRAALGK